MKIILTYFCVVVLFALATLLVAAAGGVQWGTSDAGLIAGAFVFFSVTLGPLAAAGILDALE